MFPNLLYFFWLLLQSFTAFSLIIPAIFCLFYLIRQSTTEQQTIDEELHEEKDYAIIISASETSKNITKLLQSLLQLNYTNYLVYVAGKYSADNTILCDDKLVYLRTAKSFHNQAFTHRFVIENFRRPHTHMVTLDGDSLVDSDYLTKLNTFFHQGYQAVASRKAFQNTTGIKSVLQSATNLYRNFFTGEIMFSLGSSAALSCSGIAFTVSFYKQCLKKIKAHDIDFAAALQTQTIKRDKQVAFASQAVVYSTLPVSRRDLARHHAQRVHSWFIDLFFYCRISVTGLLRGNANQLLYGISSMRLPLTTSVTVALACFVVNTRVHPAMAFFWVGSLLLLPIYLAIAAKQLSKRSGQSETGIQEDSAIDIFLYGQGEDYGMIAQTV